MSGAIYSFSIIFGSLFFGYFIRKRNIIANTEELSKAVIKNTFRFISPIILCLSFWKLNLANLSIWTLPLVGLVTCTILLILSKYFAGLHKLSPAQTGSYITTAMFSNIGYTLGGFLCFILCGETGLALAIMYTLFYTPYFYTIGFHVARHYGQERGGQEREKSRRPVIDDIRFFPFIGLALGIGFNLSQIPRPAFFAYALKALVPAATFCYFSSIGLTFRFSAVKRFKGVCFSVSVLKFVVSPLVGVGLAYVMGYHRILEALPMKIVLIESAMPVALSALLLTKFFGIDRDLANACWLVTTFMMVPIIPILIHILSLL